VDGWDIVALLGVGLGIVLRLRFLLSGRALWLDEAMLALNVLARPYRQLLVPLDYDQAAPPLFLWATRLTGLAGGATEVALRAIPFAAGVAVLVLVWRLARRFLSPEIGALAAILAAVSPSLIYYSAEYKPYMTDAAIGLGLLALAGWVGRAGAGRARGAVLMGAGILALGMSFTAPFLLATVGIALFVRGVAVNDRRLAAVAVGLGMVWLVAFGILHTWYLGTVADNPYLQDFWSKEFLGRSDSLMSAGWRVTMTIAAPLPVAARDGWAGALVLLLGGLGVLAVKGHGVGPVGVLVAPGVMGLLASLANQYPVDVRLFMFAAPLTLLIAAAGLVSGARLVVTNPRLRGGLLLAAILGIAWGSGAPAGWGPGMDHGDAGPIRQVQARPAGSLAYILPGGGPKWVFYTTDWAAPDTARLQWYAGVLSSGGAAFQNATEVAGLGWPPSPALVPPGRVGEVVAYADGWNSADRVSDWADAEVRRVLELATGEVWLYAGTYHDRVLPALIQAFGRRGVRAERVVEAEGEVVLRLGIGPDPTVGG